MRLNKDNEKERTHSIHELEYSEGQHKQIEELLETLYNTNSDNDRGNNHVQKRDGNPCTWFLNGEGTCRLNGSVCVNPFSEEGCKIQDDEIFHNPTEPRFKEGRIPLHILTKKDVFKKLDVKGRLVADYFIPYSKIDMMNVSPSLIIKNAIDVVRDKYKKGDFCGQAYDAELYIFQNVELFSGVIGIYVIKV